MWILSNPDQSLFYRIPKKINFSHLSLVPSSFYSENVSAPHTLVQLMVEYGWINASLVKLMVEYGWINASLVKLMVEYGWINDELYLGDL